MTTTELAVSNGSALRTTITLQDIASMFDKLAIDGDVSGLSEKQRIDYYKLVCEYCKIDPLTQPFNFIRQDQKVTLYANKSATAQLTRLHGLKVKIESRDVVQATQCLITASAENPTTGAYAEDIGSVSIEGLKGAALSNAIMKAATKAKRRAILSVCGLGFISDAEVEDMPKNEIEVLPTNIYTLKEGFEESVELWHNEIENCTNAEELTDLVGKIKNLSQDVRDAVKPLVETRQTQLGVIWKGGRYIPKETT